MVLRTIRAAYNIIHATFLFVRFFFLIHIWSHVGAFIVGQEPHRNRYRRIHSRIYGEQTVPFESWFAALGTPRSIKVSLRSYLRNLRGGAWLRAGDAAPDVALHAASSDEDDGASVSLLSYSKPGRLLVTIFGSCS